MQAQTVQERRGTPWIALLLALIFAAAVVIGVQVVFHGRDTVVTNVPAVQTQVDRNGSTAVAPLWTSHAQPRQPLTAEQVAKSRQILTGPTDPSLMPTITRIRAMKNGR